MVLVADAGKDLLPIGSGPLEGVPTCRLYHVQVSILKQRISLKDLEGLGSSCHWEDAIRTSSASATKTY